MVLPPTHTPWPVFLVIERLKKYLDGRVRSGTVDDAIKLLQIIVARADAMRGGSRVYAERGLDPFHLPYTWLCVQLDLNEATCVEQIKKSARSLNKQRLVRTDARCSGLNVWLRSRLPT